MRGWLRYFTLNAQSRTGLSAAVLTWAIIAAVAAPWFIQHQAQASRVPLAPGASP